MSMSGRLTSKDYFCYILRHFKKGGRLRLTEGNTKNLCLKSNLAKDFAAVVYFSEVPSPPKLLSRGGQAIL